MQNILNAATQAEEISQSFATRIGGLEKLVADKEATALANAAKYGKATGEQDRAVRQTVQQATRNAAKREAGEYRRNLVKSSQDERFNHLKALKALDDRAGQLEPLYESPVQMLSRVGLGTPDRSRYQEQLAHAGPRELLNHARWAEAHGDKMLAAAVLSRLDALPSAQRPMKAADFADKMIGEEHRAIRDALKRTRTAVQQAINVNRDFERGRVDATAKIALGLARGQA